MKDIQTNYKKYLKYLLLVSIIFILDRLSKLYILNLAENTNLVDIYVNSYLNLYLVWNKGIAFGLFSFDENYFYNFITILIIIVTFVILIMIYKANDFKVYFLLLIISGALGNLFDRLYYTAVPDFIDFHINDIHWFIFNVADIFISIGVICLILDEIFVNHYNPEWLVAWNSNLDIQPVMDYFAIITYVTDYWAKADQGVTPFLKEAAENLKTEPDQKKRSRQMASTFLTHRQMGEAEAYFKIFPNLTLKYYFQNLL